MICPVCKNSHPDWFRTHTLPNFIPVSIVGNSGRGGYDSIAAFLCMRCGVSFCPLTPEDLDVWDRKREQEEKELQEEGHFKKEKKRR